MDITRKQSNFYLEKFGLYYLVGSKEAKPDEFSEIGQLVEIWSPPNAFSGYAYASDLMKSFETQASVIRPKKHNVRNLES